MMSGIQDCVLRLQNESCMDVFVCIFQVASWDQCAMVGMVSQCLWNRRNKWVWYRVNGSAFGVNAAALNLLANQRRAREVGVRDVHQVGHGGLRQCKPLVGWVKINVDDAILSNTHVGIDVVIRSSTGQFLRARCGQITGAWQVREAEALSLRAVLIWAKDLALDHCVFESD